MEVKKHILSLLNTRKKIYSEDPRIIIEDYRKEQEKIDEYNGRQLLELLQNADDAAVSAKNKCCYISLEGNKLIVANNGDPFTCDGIESLMYSNLSPKMKEQNKIGQKGLGFRSVLSWANKVTIKSADFALEFSKDIALEFLQDVKKSNLYVDEIINEKTSENEEDTIAILRCPKVLDEIPEEYSKYDTYIVVELKKNQIEKVVEQINKELDMEVLLFLNNLETISVEYLDEHFTLRKEINGDCITITYINKDGQSQKTWHVKTKSGKIKGNEEGKSKEKNYEIKIAWTDLLDDRKNILYSYFKTNIKFPFPALVHATFDLTSDRNRLLPENEFNNNIKDLLKGFLIDVATIIAAQGDTSYKALKLLCVNDNDILTQKELVDKIKEKESDKKIFPTITDKYISYIDNPIFLEHNYASLITSDEKLKFETLLKFSDDSSVVNLLENIGVIKVPSDEIISDMSKLFLTKESRAQLIFWLSQEKFGWKKPKNLVQLLIDTNGTTAALGDVVFLPPAGGQSLVIPNDLHLKIMDLELYNKLRLFFNESNAEVMASKMEMFDVKVYRFADIFRMLVQDNTTQFDKELIIKLYNLYINNKDSGIDIIIPSQQNIFVLNRNGEVVKTSEVYFGNDYGNSLCELLYQYDQSKFISSPDKLGLDGMDFVNDFLLWLGVVDKPRYVTISLWDDEKKDYGNYVLDNYPFSEHGLWGYWKKENFNDEYGIDSVKVSTIDGLNDILNNSNETILWWLLKDDRIVNNTKEPKKESKIVFHKYKGKNDPTINNEYMPSYLLWKLSITKWIKMENDKVAPCQCCVSKSITEDFSPLIEVPKIDYKSLKSFDKREIEYVLHRIGVKTEIKDFSQQTIYSILNRLFDIDKDGKKARLLYRELVENLDEDDIDVNLLERKDFIEKGKVFCKQGNQYSYESVKNVYYLQDKIYGENIVNQFKTIAIDRRRNSTIIKLLFGVEPLANLQFSLKEPPIINESLNAELQRELKNLTPYIYALRSSNSKDNYFGKLSDDWSVQVCSEILPVYKKKEDDEKKGFELNDYEFVYVSENNTYYILIQNSCNYTLGQLKSDYRFVDVVSEIYSNILKVDSIRPLVSRLFEADTKKRNYILNTEIDDSESKLKEAQKQLNIVRDQKVMFWLGVLESTLGEDVDKDKEYEKTELENFVNEKIGIQIDDYTIDYNELASENCNVTEITRLFNQLGIDVALFNKHSYYNLNLVPYYKKYLTGKKIEKESVFERLLYEQVQDKTLEEKKNFIFTIKDYYAYNDFKVYNCINVNLDFLLNKIVLNKFNVDMATLPKLSGIKQVYDKHYGKLMEDNELNCEEFKIFLNDSDENRSLVYFAEYYEIKKNYQEYRSRIETENGIKFNGNQIKGNDLSEIYQELINQQDIVNNLVIKDIKTEKVLLGNHNWLGRQGGARISRRRMPEKRKKRIGFIGEVLVYKKLKEQYGDVSWDSGYAKEANENPKGDDMNHYDIRYKKDDEYYYVEVKSTTTDNLEFEISELEFEFGKEKKKNYEIFIVTNVENQNREIKNIGNPFIFEEGESLMNCQRFTVLNDSFIIKMNEKK